MSRPTWRRASATSCCQLASGSEASNSIQQELLLDAATDPFCKTVNCTPTTSVRAKMPRPHLCDVSASYIAQ